MKRLAFSVLALFSANIATLAGGIVLPMMIARTLDETALGIFSTASILGLLVTTVIDWGHETRLPILIPSLNNDVPAIHGIITRVQALKATLWCVAVALCTSVWFVSSYLFNIDALAFSSPFKSPLFLCSALFLLWALCRAQMATYSAVLRGLAQFGVVARLENICSVGMYVVCIATLLGTQHLALALTVFPCAECIKLLFFRQYLKKYYPNKAPQRLHWRDFTGMLREQASFVVLQGVSIVESRAGMFALGWLALAQSEVGYFGAAMRFVIALRTFGGALFNVVLPSFAKNDAIDNTDLAISKKNLLCQTLLGGGAVAGIGSIVLFIFAEPLISLIYGAKLLPAVPILRIVAALFFLQTLVNILEAYLLARRQEHFVNVTMAGVVMIFFAGMCIAHVVSTSGVRADIAAWGSLYLSTALLGIYTIKTLRLRAASVV